MRTKVASLVAVSLGVLLGGCGDLGDPTLVSADAMTGETVVQSLEIDISAPNFFPDPLPPEVYFSLTYDEPIDLSTARANIVLDDPNDVGVPITITQSIVDVIVTPSRDLAPGDGNYTIRIAPGIDDESSNTTDYEVNVTFAVETM